MLRGLERQERRIELARHERTPVEALTPYRTPDRVREQPREPVKARQPSRRLGPVGVFFMRTKRARRLAGLGSRWLDRLIGRACV